MTFCYGISATPEIIVVHGVEDASSNSPSWHLDEVVGWVKYPNQEATQLKNGLIDSMLKCK